MLPYFFFAGYYDHVEIYSLTGGYAQRPGELPVQRGYSARLRGPISCSTFNNATVVVHQDMLANVGGLTVVASQ